MTEKKLFVIFSSETTLILIHLSHGTKFDPKSPKFNLSHLARGGGGLNPNETLSHSNGKFVFDHGPNWNFKPTTWKNKTIFGKEKNSTIENPKTLKFT